MPIDTEGKSHITCPHCGYKDLDSWESGMEGDGDTVEMECKSCEKEFEAELTVEVSYSTTKLEESSIEKEKP